MGVKRTSADMIEVVRSGKRFKGPTTAKAMAKEALKRVNRIEREVESKAIDDNFTVAAAAAGTISEVSLIDQGVGREERIGDTVIPTKLEIGFYASATTGTAIRYLVIQSHGDYAPAVGSVTAEVLESATLMAPINFNNRKQFSVLFDKAYVIDSPDATDNNVVVDLIKVFPKRKIQYDSATPAYGSGTIDGAIYIVQVGDGSAASIVSSPRLWYKDA